MDATCQLAMPWSEAEKLKKKQRGIDPRDVIDIVQRYLVLIGNAHYVCLTDARNKGWGAVRPRFLCRLTALIMLLLPFKDRA